MEKWLGRHLHRVIPAKAGTPVFSVCVTDETEIPAFAGMTRWQVEDDIVALAEGLPLTNAAHLHAQYVLQKKYTVSPTP